VVRGVEKIRKIAAIDVAEFFANRVRGEAGAKKHAVERGDFLLVEGAAKVRESAFETRANESGFVRFGKDCGERCVDVFIGNAPATQFARDAVASLAAALCVMAGVFDGVAGIVKVVQFAKAGDDGRDELLFFCATLEILFHFMDRVIAAHEGALGGHIELVFGPELAGGSCAHGC